MEGGADGGWGKGDISGHLYGPIYTNIHRKYTGEKGCKQGCMIERGAQRDFLSFFFHVEGSSHGEESTLSPGI